MKKNIVTLFSLAAAALMLVGCNEDLLDNSGVSGTSQPTEELTAAQLAEGSAENPNIPAAFIGGLYAQMVQRASGGNPDSHMDFGHKSYDVFSDMVSGDMALSVSTYGWYRAAITELQAMEDFTFGENRMVWRYYYRIVRSANTVISNLGGNDAIPENIDNRYAMGQAKAMRAHSYFYLTQFFQKNYDPAEAILPMYLEPGSENIEKSTAEAIYTQMEKDLDDAISLLEGFTRAQKNEVDQNVARMILAYVLGAKGGRDGDVATLTQTVINSTSHTMLAAADVTNGFNDVNTNSWMWGIDITENLELGLVSWWGQIDAYSYSYAWAGDYKVMDADLYAQIPADDARKGQFLNDPSSGRHLQPLTKFFASNEIGGTSRTVTADYVYMRIEEAYLLNAEANAKSGNEPGARASLKALMELRVPDASYVDALAGTNLRNEIYLQTRIELWGEGKSYLAMKRNQATTTRGANHLSLVGTPIDYNDERFQFEIPLDEIQNNPFINNQNN